MGLPCIFLLLILGLASPSAQAQSYEKEPVLYSETQPENRVSRLSQSLLAGDVQLGYDTKFGYLPALLKSLEVSESSQMLVFSKTSMQRQRISPRTPRALYFGDDVYIGYCHNGEVLEITADDPRLGAVFYTLNAHHSDPPRILRQTDNCLLCHGGSQTRDTPGHLVRSLLVDSSGTPLLARGTYRIDHTSPFEQRWGGWYVTGKHGTQSHRGNLIIHKSAVSDEIDNTAGQNVTDLSDLLDTSHYPTAHSDIVALLVLEHQTEAMNLITRANHLTREALHYQDALNRELGEAPDHVWDSTRSRIRAAGEPLVEYLLMSREAPLTGPIEGTSGYAAQFVQRGPRDKQGRALREFDLRSRLFKYPCSYTVYSPSFAALPREMRDYVFKRLRSVLSGEDTSKPYAHLTPADRAAVREILTETLPGFAP